MISKIKKRYIFIPAAVIAAVCLAAAFFIFIKPALSTVEFEYTLKPESGANKAIGVNIRIGRKSLISPRTFTLGKGNFAPDGTRCTDSAGKSVLFSEKEGKLVIGPVGGNTKYVDLSYQVGIGDFDGNVNQGAYYSDLIAFSGDNTLYFPYFSYEDGSYGRIGRSISEITLKSGSGKAMNPVFPYQDKYGTGQAGTVKIKNPDWKVFYNLGKSCYAFGSFDKTSVEGEKGDLDILLDPQFKSKLPEETAELIRSLYDYYAGLFGSGLQGYTVLILRNDPSNMYMNFAGVGGKSLGISVNPYSANEIKTFSHSLYSAFFDSCSNTVNLHYQPNLWLYKGLAAYYENMSLDSLPENIKSRFGFSSEEGFRELYTRYIYFRLKEPVMYKLSPADEKSALPGQLQFLFYTEAPLVIKNIEEIASANEDKREALLSYLLDRKDSGTINIGDMMPDILGRYEQTARNYLTGDTILPYSGTVAGSDDPDRTVAGLDSYERLLCGWNQQAIPIYPYDKIYLADPGKLADEIIARDIKFASDDVEKMVGNFSPTVFMLLKQYRLRADVCGLKDMEDPMLKYKLISDRTNEDKWYAYLEKSGIDAGGGNDTGEAIKTN